MKTIDRAIRMALDAGYSIELFFEQNSEGDVMTLRYKLLKDLEAFGHGIKIRDYKENPECAILTGGTLDILGHSIIETIEKEKVFA